MDAPTPCPAADTGMTTPMRLWLGLANALAIELAVALAVALLVVLLFGGLPC